MAVCFSEPRRMRPENRSQRIEFRRLEAWADPRFAVQIDRLRAVAFWGGMRRYHVLWYGRPAPQSGTSPVGIYDGGEEGVKATLTLHPDHSFDQEIIRPGISATARGTWATAQNGGVTFSQAFLKTSGKPLEEEESATADDPGGSNLQIVVANTSSSGEPIFRKKHFW